MTNQGIFAVIHGRPGSGKSSACFQLPNVFYIDTEGSTDFLRCEQDIDGKISDAITWPDILSSIKDAIASSCENVVIDTLSSVVAILAQYVKNKAYGGEFKEYNSFGKGNFHAKDELEELRELILQLNLSGKNVWLLCHSEKEDVKRGSSKCFRPTPTKFVDRFEQYCSIVAYMERTGTSDDPVFTLHTADTPDWVAKCRPRPIPSSILISEDGGMNDFMYYLELTRKRPKEIDSIARDAIQSISQERREKGLEVWSTMQGRELRKAQIAFLWALRAGEYDV